MVELPTQRHTIEEMDALLDAVTDGLTAAREAIDAYRAEREQWINDNPEAYVDAAGGTHEDARKVEDAIARMVDLIVLTFHRDRALSAEAYGLTLDAVLAQLKLTYPAMEASLARHSRREDDPPPPPPPEGETTHAQHHGARHKSKAA